MKHHFFYRKLTIVKNGVCVCVCVSVTERKSESLPINEAKRETHKCRTKHISKSKMKLCYLLYLFLVNEVKPKANGCGQKANFKAQMDTETPKTF